MRLHDEDAVELIELLEFVADWIDYDFVRLRTSQDRFTAYGYSTENLRGDLARFIHVLGGPTRRLTEDDDEGN